MKNKCIVITPGDPDGIGPEVTAKALYQLKSKLSKHEIILFGARKAFSKYSTLLPKSVQFFEPPLRASPGYQSGWAIEMATQFVMAAPKSRILITGPISKERLQQGGYFFNGHTDFLAKLSRTPNVTMMLANDFFRVSLVTNHCAIKEVSSQLTEKKLLTTFEHTRHFVKDYLHQKKPKLAILGLNPHAGENDILGTEENKIIIPAMKLFSEKYSDVRLSGPHPADSFFAIEKTKKKSDQHHAVVAMYHDQGLIPIKLSNFNDSLNITLGLPFTRTSVDHGTAFDISGKNKADPSSMNYAIRKALEYSNES